MLTLSIAPAQLSRNYFAADAVTRVAPESVAPRPAEINAGNALLYSAFTPTGTTVTLAFTGANNLRVLTGATERLGFSVGNDIDTTSAFHMRVWARRKPGATGSIAAQEIVVKAGVAAANELGRLKVQSTAAGTDEPVCDWIDFVKQAGDARFTFTAANPLTLTDTVDSDLEIVVEAHGTD